MHRCAFQQPCSARARTTQACEAEYCREKRQLMRLKMASASARTPAGNDDNVVRPCSGSAPRGVRRPQATLSPVLGARGGGGGCRHAACSGDSSPSGRDVGGHSLSGRSLSEVGVSAAPGSRSNAGSRPRSPSGNDGLGHHRKRTPRACFGSWGSDRDMQGLGGGHPALPLSGLLDSASLLLSHALPQGDALQHGGDVDLLLPDCGLHAGSLLDAGHAHGGSRYGLPHGQRSHCSSGQRSSGGGAADSSNSVLCAAPHPWAGGSVAGGVGSPGLGTHGGAGRALGFAGLCDADFSLDSFDFAAAAAASFGSDASLSGVDNWLSPRSMLAVSTSVATAVGAVGGGTIASAHGGTPVGTPSLAAAPAGVNALYRSASARAPGCDGCDANGVGRRSSTLDAELASAFLLFNVPGADEPPHHSHSQPARQHQHHLSHVPLAAPSGWGTLQLLGLSQPARGGAGQDPRLDGGSHAQPSLGSGHRLPVGGALAHCAPALLASTPPLSPWDRGKRNGSPAGMPSGLAPSDSMPPGVPSASGAPALGFPGLRPNESAPDFAEFAQSYLLSYGDEVPLGLGSSGLCVPGAGETGSLMGMAALAGAGPGSSDGSQHDSARLAGGNPGQADNGDGFCTSGLFSDVAPMDV